MRSSSATPEHSAHSSTTASSSRSRAQQGEPVAEQEPRKRPAALEYGQEGDAPRLRDEERPRIEAGEARCAQVGPHVFEPVLPRVEVEHELALGVGANACEERTP